jgi:hypothetical protein
MGSVSMRQRRDCFAHILRNKPSPPSSRKIPPVEKGERLSRDRRASDRFFCRKILEIISLESIGGWAVHK